MQALHRVRERLVSQRTGIINQFRAFMLERAIAETLATHGRTAEWVKRVIPTLDRSLLVYRPKAHILRCPL